MDTLTARLHPDGLLIRDALPEDLAALHRLVERAYRGDSARAGWTSEAHLLGGQRTDPAALRESLADAARSMLLVEPVPDAADQTTQGTDPIGCVELTDVGRGRAYLGLLTVDPARQAGGLGRRLITAAEDAARTRYGATFIEMTVIRQRPELIAWYERRGYRLTGEERPFPLNDRRFGEPLTRELVFVVLEKRLD